MNVLKLDAFFEKKTISPLTIKQIRGLKLPDRIFDESISEKELSKLERFISTHISVGIRRLSPGVSSHVENSDYEINKQERIVFFRESDIGYTTTIKKLEQFVKDFPDWKLSFDDNTVLEIHSGRLTTKAEIDCDNSKFYTALLTEEYNKLNLLFVNITFISQKISAGMFCHLVNELNIEDINFVNCMYNTPYLFERRLIYSSSKNSNILLKSDNPRFQKMLNTVGW